MSANPHNHYWSLANDDAHVFSSAINSLVATTDNTYVAWQAAGNRATPVDNVTVAIGIVIRLQ